MPALPTSRRRLLAVLGLTAALAVPAGVALGGADRTASSEGATHDRHRVAVATMRAADGSVAGRLLIRRHGAGLHVYARVRGVAPGFHGFHVHAVGTCDPTTIDPATGGSSPFLSAGGHLARPGEAHGGHAGDMPPLYVNADGTATAAFTIDRFRARDLKDADGSAVIVHAGPDNLANIPPRYSTAAPDGTRVPGPDEITLRTGDSGGRVLCGILRVR